MALPMTLALSQAEVREKPAHTVSPPLLSAFLETSHPMVLSLAAFGCC